MIIKSEQGNSIPSIGLDIGVFSVKGVLIENGFVEKVYRPASGNPVAVAGECLNNLVAKTHGAKMRIGLTGNNARLVADELGINPIIEAESLQAGISSLGIKGRAVLSLGHENMYYLEIDPSGAITFFNRNGQCAAGSGSFWYQQATRMGYNDRELAEEALKAESPVKISGRCAVFAKSDMTHAINGGASQMAVAAGLAKTLVDLVVTGVAQNRIKGPGTLITVGGVANNRAILKYLGEYCSEHNITLSVPDDHEYINALGAAQKGFELSASRVSIEKMFSRRYVPENPLPPLQAEKVIYGEDHFTGKVKDLSIIYLGVDCGSVSTKCVLLDGEGQYIGGVYLPTAGRPALQVLELMKEINEKFKDIMRTRPPVVACTTGSGRFLAQKILAADYAADEITCQAEGIKSLFEEHDLAVIEIGGEDSKFIQIKNDILFDYNMNPVCAAGTGTFLENLAELLGVQIKEEFSQKAFQAAYAIDLGDNCTLLSQSALVAAASRGLPLDAQLASLAYSAARNYLSRTVENRVTEGKLVFTGATAKNHALASAFAAICGRDILVPPNPELSGALGAALMARFFYLEDGKPEKPSHQLDRLNEYRLERKPCRARCPYDHHCILDVITFNDGSHFIYGDRCGRYSELEKKKKDEDLPDYRELREEIFLKAAGEPLDEGPQVGIACGGLNYEFYPFWAAFFRTLGARVVPSGESNEKILEKGKMNLAAEMCFPMEVLVGHYRELADKGTDYIFIPEIFDMEPLPWLADWPRSLSCPLMMMVKGVVAHSLDLPDDKILHARLSFHEGAERVENQLLPAARKLLGKNYSPDLVSRAVQDGYKALADYRSVVEKEGRRIIEGLAAGPDAIVALVLGRSYTLYDPFVSKNVMAHASQRGLTAIPQDFFLEYLRGWYEGRIESFFLDTHRDDFEQYMAHTTEQMDNIYSSQLQNMMAAAAAAQFFNERTAESGLPQLHLVLQDPFRCGPNSMLRHYLANVAEFLRLTLDEHTAPAGMITRLEAFKNTCLSRRNREKKISRSARAIDVNDPELKKILVPNMSSHPAVFVSLFENYGVEAVLLPRSNDKDLTLARLYTNGEECLPFLQSLQDFLAYAEQNPRDFEEQGTVMLEGWACGPCRFGYYASAQSLIINRAGYGEKRVCALKTEDAVKRFGPEFAVALFDGLLAIDMLNKMLHRTRPYEINEGESEALFDRYCKEIYAYLRHYRFKWTALPGGSHLRGLEKILAEAGKQFASISRRDEERPLILLAGEYYVRLDDRCNKDIIKQIEGAGGEVFLAPATEFFVYTVFANYRLALKEYNYKKNLVRYLYKLGYGAINWLAHRDEQRIEKAAGVMLEGREEPSASEILAHSINYIPEHTAGEPPMTIGRTGALAGRKEVAGAIFVGPFTCMPASVVEAVQGALSREIGIPIISVFYDGRDNVNREEFIHSLVFQAKQNLKTRT